MNGYRLGFRMTALVGVACLSALLAGCANSPRADAADTARAKKFVTSSPNVAGLYVFRLNKPSVNMKKNLWIDGYCMGETEANSFLYIELEAGRTHTLQTDREFSVATLEIPAQAGKTYFVRQNLKSGSFSTWGKLQEVPPELGKRDIAKLAMVEPGKCSEFKR